MSQLDIVFDIFAFEIEIGQVIACIEIAIHEGGNEFLQPGISVGCAAFSLEQHHSDSRSGRKDAVFSRVRQQFESL